MEKRWKTISRDFNRYYQEFRRFHAGKAEYLRVIEKHKDGYPHIHIIIQFPNAIIRIRNTKYFDRTLYKKWKAVINFGAGYGAGVRIGYDVIYPKIAPFAAKITDDIIGQVGKLFGGDAGQIAAQSGAPSGFKFASQPKQGFLDKPDTTIIPKGRDRDIANTCAVSHKRWTALQRRVVSLSATVRNSTSRRITSNRQQFTRAATAQTARRELTKVSAELDNALKNPNNQSCVSTWDAKAAF